MHLPTLREASVERCKPLGVVASVTPRLSTAVANKFIIFNAKFLVFDTQFLGFDIEFVIFTH